MISMRTGIRTLFVHAAIVCAVEGVELVGTINDFDTGRRLAARIYIRSAAGEWKFVETNAAAGSALPYQEQWVPMPQVAEKHTTVSAHDFRTELSPGTYENQQPVRPRREEVEYLIKRVRTEIDRNRNILSADALQEFQQALNVYTEIAKRAR